MHVRVNFAKPAFQESIRSSIVIWMKAIFDDVQDGHDTKIITASFSHLLSALSSGFSLDAQSYQCAHHLGEVLCVHSIFPYVIE